MIEYKCELCGKIYHKKTDFVRHKNRKFPCKKEENIVSIVSTNSSNIVSKISINNANKNGEKNKNTDINDTDRQLLEGILICAMCKKAYNHRSSLSRHVKLCGSISKQTDSEKEEIFQKLFREMEEIKQKNKEIEEKNKIMEEKVNILEEENKILKQVKSPNTITTQNNNNAENIQNAEQINNIQNTVNTVNIVKFGNEDIKHISNEVFKQLLKTGFQATSNLVKRIHFNKKKPEFHNIYISNMRSNYLMVYKGKNKWDVHKVDEYLEKLYNDKNDILIEKYDELLEHLDEVTIKKFERFLNEKDEDQTINNAKEEIRYILYNNRDMPDKRRKLFEP